MTKRNNCANQNNHIDMETLLSLLGIVHPQVASIIQQVRSSTAIDKADKSMIQDQLICMCGTLNEAKKYTLRMGLWKDGHVCSDMRAQVACEKKTIRNDTVFTIVHGAGRKHLVAYIDLPIEVAI